MNAIDIEYLRQWIGRERQITDMLGHFPARALAATLNRTRVPKENDALPLGWQWLYFIGTPAASDLGADGHPKLGEFLPPAPLPRRMWAGGAMQVEHPLHLGRPAQQHSSIRSVDVKRGRSGDLLFVTLEHVLSQGGRRCITEQQKLVYRPMPTAQAPLAAGEPAPDSADWVQTVTPDPVLLFRYSALTFNSHRIHYDRPYAMDKECYPGLVVQSPLIATLLLELVHDHMPEARLRSFQFRALRPTFDSHPFFVCGRNEGDRLRLWSADHEGFTCVSAEAELA